MKQLQQHYNSTCNKANYWMITAAKPPITETLPLPATTATTATR
jgi:hypothetical protein